MPEEAQENTMSDVEPGRETKQLGGEIMRWIVPPVALAAAFGIGGAIIDACLAYFDGSYLATSITVIVGLFWACAAALAALILAAAVAVVMRGVTSDVKYAIAPACVIATAFAMHGREIVRMIDDRDALGREVLFNKVFLIAWGVMLGALAGAAAWRVRRSWMTYAAAWAAILACGGIAPWVRADMSGFTLVLGPLIGIAAMAVVTARIRGGFAAGAVTCGYVVVCGTALCLVDSRSPHRPVAPIMRTLSSPAALTQTASRPNVILIVLDTLRADHASFLGYKYQTTPNLARFAADCQVFTRATSVDSCTLPSHAAMFTGLYPRENGAHKYGAFENFNRVARSTSAFAGISPTKRTLATYLSEAGYATGGVTANYDRTSREFGFDQGFEYYYDIPRLCIFSRGNLHMYRVALNAVDRLFGCNGKLVKATWNGRAIITMGERWMRGVTGRPFFLFMNMMDVHWPFAAPPPFAHVDGAGIPYDMKLRAARWSDIMQRYNVTGKGLSDKVLRCAVNQYDGGAAYADDALGKFFQRLKQNGLYDNTLIIVTSDHGEFFTEHNRISHGRLIYEEGVHVVLMVKYPGSAHAGEVKNERVSTVDVFATVLEAAGLPLPSVTARPLGSSSHPVIAEVYRLVTTARQSGAQLKDVSTAMYSGDYKYTHSMAGANELYDLARDPKESANLVAVEPEVAARMEAAVADWFARTPAFDGTAGAAKPAQRADQGPAAGGAEDQDQD